MFRRIMNAILREPNVILIKFVVPVLRHESGTKQSVDTVCVVGCIS
jgi:hypothetical protein